MRGILIWRGRLDRSKRWLMDSGTERNEAKKAKTAFFTSLVKLLLSLIAGLAVAVATEHYTSIYLSHPTVGDRIGELARIQTSLRDLEKYVQGQQRDLASNAEALSKLEHEMKEKQTALTVSREQLESLIASAGLKAQPWYGRLAWAIIGCAVSFAIGFMSSVAANKYSVWRKVVHASVAVSGVEGKAYVGTVDIK